MANDDEILAELRRQTSWLRLLGLQTLRPTLIEVLKTDVQRLAYEASDGQHTTRQVAERSGTGPSSVSRWWAEWIAIGICSESPERPGRAQHLAPLSALGIDMPGKWSGGNRKANTAAGEGHEWRRSRGRTA